MHFGAFIAKGDSPHPQNLAKPNFAHGPSTFKNPTAATLINSSLMRNVIKEIFNKDQFDTFLIDNFKDTAVQFNPREASYDQLLNDLFRRTQPIKVWEVLTQSNEYKRLIEASMHAQQVLNQLEEPEGNDDPSPSGRSNR